MTSRMAILFLLFSLCALPGWSQIPVGGESWQLQELIQRSEQQLKEVQELLKQAKTDGTALQKASQALIQMSDGLNRSIESFQGTREYEQALLQYQKEETLRLQNEIKNGTADPKASAFLRFQNQSIQANESELRQQARLGEALKEAAPGFVPKLQTQAQLGAWQSNTRISAQLTEILGALREQQNTSSGQATGFGLFLSGTNVQFKKQKAEQQRKGAHRE